MLVKPQRHNNHCDQGELPVSFRELRVAVVIISKK